MSNSSHLLSKQNSQQPKQFRGGEKKVMKKSLSLLVAIAMVFSMFATLVSAAETTQSAGQKLQELGVIKGTANGLDEDKEWKRQDITILLARLLQVEDAAKNHANTHGFTDVNTKSYNGYISWAKENGYFTGESATVFGINKSITNQQFAAVLLRVLKVDVDYANAFEKAVELKLVSADLKATDAAIRGDIYESLLTALDYKIDGVKLGTILGLKGYEVSAVEVVKASATNSKTVKVEFNQDVKDVVANSFVVTNADGSVQVIESVSTNGAVATISLNDKLSNGKTYTVAVSGVESKDGEQVQTETATAEFTYTATTAAKVEIPTTTIAYGDKVGIVIKDANGNDITPDFDLTDASIVTVNSSATNVVDIVGNELVAQNLSANTNKSGYSVVNASVAIDDETTLETGNVIITVQSSVAVVSGFDQVTLGNIDETAVTSVSVGDTGKVLKVTVKNADGSRNSAAEDATTFKSGSPSVLVIDATTGAVTPVKSGSATVTATTTFNGKTVSKSVVITVKEKAKFTSIAVDKSSVKLVYGLDPAIAEGVKVTLLDQYGEEYTPASSDNLNVTVRVPASKANLLDGISNTASNFDQTGITDKSFNIGLEVLSNVDAANSANVTVQVGDIKKTVAVSIVKQGNPAGYVAEIDNLKIDANADLPAANKNALAEKTATVTVYAKDSNGNKIKAIEAGTGSEEFTLVDEDKDIAVASGNTINPGSKTGSEKVTVLVNGVKVATFTVNVVDTTASLTKVTQVKNAITVASGASLEDALFGYDNNGTFVKGAFVAYDQYGAVVDFSSVTPYIYSADTTIIDGTTLKANGNVLLTIVVKDIVYTITVKVTGF